MTGPDRIRVAAFTYRLEYLPGIPNDGETYGHWNAAQCCIQLRHEVSPQRVADAFLHEVTHAGLEAMGYGCEVADGEAAATFNGLFWPMFWRDNPEALEWWLGLVRGEVK